MKTIEDLNASIDAGEFTEIVQVAEALYDKQLVELASEIASRRHVRLVLIAGPSSAGKTTTAMHLKYHLRACGLRPLMLSTDDYFVGDELNPRDENGKLDYEHIEAMDLKRLNADLSGLLEGREVMLRNFDFETRTGFDDKAPTRLADDEVVVMEGLHCLNPRLTETIPAEWKFLVYIRLASRLSFADGSRIHNTDLRLVRRILRDQLFRNRPPRETLELWPSVRRGEERWIFPFESNADATFNSALEYELPILKPLVEPFLAAIADDPEYGAEARRLAEFLGKFREAPATSVPSDSLLREYIGGSSLEY